MASESWGALLATRSHAQQFGFIDQVSGWQVIMNKTSGVRVAMSLSDGDGTARHCCWKEIVKVAWKDHSGAWLV